MAEATPSTPEEQLGEFLKRAEKSANDAEENSKKVSEIINKINDLLVKAGDAQKKADDEALRAYNAKEQIEEHSKAVAKLRAEADGIVSSLNNKIPGLEALAQTIT